jgi:amino acid transporter
MSGGREPRPAKPKTMGVFGAAFLGLGAMVGAGIFALLGEAGAIAGSAVWLSFLIAGAIALLLGYTVAKLGTRYPSSGGVVAYINQAFGKGHLSGTSSWLFYFAGLIVTAMTPRGPGSTCSRRSWWSPWRRSTSWGQRPWRRCSR